MCVRIIEINARTTVAIIFEYSTYNPKPRNFAHWQADRLTKNERPSLMHIRVPSRRRHRWNHALGYDTRTTLDSNSRFQIQRKRPPSQNYYQYRRWTVDHRNLNDLLKYGCKHISLGTWVISNKPFLFPTHEPDENIQNQKLRNNEVGTS